MVKYTPIRVSTLRGDLKIPFNAYVSVAGKHILMCREGDSFEGARFERLKLKKLINMYIREDELSAYKTYINENLDRAYEGAKNKPIDIRAQIIQGLLQASAEDLTQDPGHSDFYNMAIEGSRRFAKFLFTEPAALKAMLEIVNSDFNIAHHSGIVAALSLAIAEELGFTDSRPMQMDFMTVGCLVHDIEHQYNNINRKVRAEALSKPEITLHEQHGQKGFERLSRLNTYDPLILDIVQNHEEKMDGSGPRKLKEKDMNPLTTIVSTANIFDQYLAYDKMTPKEALKKLLIDKVGVLTLESMKALQDALKKRQII